MAVKTKPKIKRKLPVNGKPLKQTIVDLTTVEANNLAQAIQETQYLNEKLQASQSKGEALMMLVFDRHKIKIKPDQNTQIKVEGKKLTIIG